jgi:predicted CoA-binding protein
MPWKNPSDEALRELIASSKTIAVVGCSPDPSRTSHQIAAQMQRRGYRIIPVHPAGGTILGEKVYAELDSIPKSLRIDIVDVFRRAPDTPPIAEAAVRTGARALWLQQGIVNEQACDIAQKGGLICVMDLCLGVMQRVLLGGGNARQAE